MSGLTWFHISDWLQKWGKEFGGQVIRAAPVRDIRGRTAIGPDHSMIDLLDPLLNACDVGPYRLFMVPGSHEHGSNFFKNLPPEIKKPPRSEEEVHRKIWG